MTVGAKLMVLVAGSLAMSLVSFASYFAINSPLENLASERQLLTQVSTRATALQVQANQMLSDVLETRAGSIQSSQTGRDAQATQALLVRANLQMSDILKTRGDGLATAIQDFNDANQAMQTMVYLPRVNPTVKEALDGLSHLHEISASSLSTLSDAIEELQTASRNFVQSKTSGQGMTTTQITNLIEAFGSLNEVLGASSETITAQGRVIDEEVSKAKAWNLLLSLLVVGLLFLGTALVSWILARSISRSLRFIDKNIAVLASGDLTFRFHLGAKDEVGSLARNLDGLMDWLKRSMETIQGASRENTDLKEKLTESVLVSEASAIEISSHSTSIRTQMIRLDEMIAEGHQAIEGISGTFHQFHHRIGQQNRNIEESVASVTQMLASIENITRITQQDRQASEALVRNSEAAQAVFEDAFGKITEISESVSQIQEMAAVIAHISDATKILALNAAIEAAHAGAFGKGFAVVADEISKLAAASAASSSEIAQTIGAVIAKISEATMARDSMAGAFGSISGQIVVVSDSITEIYSNVTEMQTGSHQILQAMADLRSASGEITSESGLIEKGHQDMGATITTVGRISREVVTNIGEIAAGLQDITGSVHQVSEWAVRIGEIGADLDEAVHRFKTDGAPETRGSVEQED